MFICLNVYMFICFYIWKAVSHCSILLWLYSISSGALGSSDLLLSYPTTTLASHVSIILIITIP